MMLTWLVAVWISTCGVNGHDVPCPAVRIIEGPVSEEQCSRDWRDRTLNYDQGSVYECAKLKVETPVAVVREAVHFAPSPIADPEGEGRFQLSPDGAVKVYE
jgi:hypothetical protein